MFDKASILKPTISQKVEIEKTKGISQQAEIKKTKGISQQVESDATSPSLERSV